MLENREKRKVLQNYEEPSVQIAYLEGLDVLTASTDVGEEYPSDWN